MKRILIHIGSLNAGGAEKSLVSFLNTLPKDKYEIDLMLLRDGGLFRSLIPSYVNVINPPFPYSCLGVSPSNWKFYIKHNPKYILKKINSLQKIKQNKTAPVDQVLWPLWDDCIKSENKEYDVAISYLEGLSNYFIIDKVNAKRKVLWVHNEYTKLGYDKNFDRVYFEKADAIVTISDTCRNDLVNNFPELKNKFYILENITNPRLIKMMAEEEFTDPAFNNRKETFKILSIGRLHSQKNYPLAIRAARILKDRGVDFKWYIIGEGALRTELEKQINDLLLQDNVLLLGLRSNPYPYIKESDVVVQSSLYEGKSIAIDEAKILCKPIVVTNYPTVYDVISDNINGLIVDMNPSDLSDKIEKLYNDKLLRERLTNNLREEAIDNTIEIKRYIKIIDAL